MGAKKDIPNPLPCGCGIKGSRDFNDDTTRMIYIDLFIAFCPLHTNADRLRASLVKILPCAEEGRNNELDADIDEARAVLAHTEPKPKRKGRRSGKKTT